MAIAAVTVKDAKHPEARDLREVLDRYLVVLVGLLHVRNVPLAGFAGILLDNALTFSIFFLSLPQASTLQLTLIPDMFGVNKHPSLLSPTPTVLNIISLYIPYPILFHACPIIPTCPFRPILLYQRHLSNF